jgi:hypothetical protein
MDRGSVDGQSHPIGRILEPAEREFGEDEKKFERIETTGNHA